MITVDLTKVCSHDNISLCSRHGKGTIWWMVQGQQIEMQDYQDLLALDATAVRTQPSETFLGNLDFAVSEITEAAKLHRRGIRPTGQQTALNNAMAAIRAALMEGL